LAGETLRIRCKDPGTITGFNVWVAKGNYKTMEEGIRALLLDKGVLPEKKVF